MSADGGPLGTVSVHEADSLAFLQTQPAGKYQLIYVDPPFNTGKVQSQTRLKTERVASGADRVGFGGHGYRTTRLGQKTYGDRFDDYLGFLLPRLEAAIRVMSPEGSLFVHLDYREVHYVKVALDEMLGRACFMNEIIWAYDYGARSRSRWSTKHDNLLWYVRDPKHYTFHFDAMDRIPYMAPGLVGKEKAARGKTPTDVWWHTIVAPGGRERTGYPSQKPLGVLKRVIAVHSSPGDHVLDCFAGSGTTGEAAAQLGRHATLVDRNPDAVAVMNQRLAAYLTRPPGEA